MSLILEALNRARREQHNAAPVPGVDSEHFSPAAAENPWRQRALLAALALALLVIGVLLGREFSRDQTAPTTAVAETAVVEAEHTLAVVEAPAPESPVASSPAPETREAPSAVVPDAPVALLANNESPQSTPVDASQPGSAPGPADRTRSAEVAALYEQAARPERAVTTVPTSATAPTPASEEPVDIAGLVTAAEQALEDVRLAEHPAPFLGDLSQQRKDAVPTLMYLQHDYRSTGGSSVTINSQQAGAGQTVGRGVRVEEILPDSVVLSHDGQQFRLRALNSWVNL
ncbi:MAG: general secretion pathway protein GspB [Haliea sp.]